jgi:hypothetical protein
VVESPLETHQVADLFVAGRLRDKRVAVVPSAVRTQGIDGLTARAISVGLGRSRERGLRTWLGVGAGTPPGRRSAVRLGGLIHEYELAAE